MHIEYACYDEPILHKAKQNIFEAMDLGVNLISTTITYLPAITDLLPKDVQVSCPIDYPDGFSDTQLKIHYITRAINRGANVVDVVANIPLFYLNSYDFEQEFKVLDSMCFDKNVELRVMLDSKKMVDPNSDMPDILHILNSCCINYVFCNTGKYIEDYSDDLIMCNLAENIGIKAISNSRINTQEQMNNVECSEIFGIRFNNLNGLKRCVFGV